MRKPDEIALFAAIRQRAPYTTEPTVRRIVAEIGINEARAAAILEKWAGKGWYEYGVNVLAGWLTPDAPERLQP